MYYLNFLTSTLSSVPEGVVANAHLVGIGSLVVVIGSSGVVVGPSVVVVPTVPTVVANAKLSPIYIYFSQNDHSSFD